MDRFRHVWIAPAHNVLHVRKLLVWGDDDGLHEELVAALGIGSRRLPHRLQEDCDGQHESRAGELGRVLSLKHT